MCGPEDNEYNLFIKELIIYSEGFNDFAKHERLELIKKPDIYLVF